MCYDDQNGANIITDRLLCLTHLCSTFKSDRLVFPSISVGLYAACYNRPCTTHSKPSMPPDTTLSWPSPFPSTCIPFSCTSPLPHRRFVARRVSDAAAGTVLRKDTDRHRRASLPPSAATPTIHSWMSSLCRFIDGDAWALSDPAIAFRLVVGHQVSLACVCGRRPDMCYLILRSRRRPRW